MRGHGGAHINLDGTVVRGRDAPTRIGGSVQDGDFGSVGRGSALGAIDKLVDRRREAIRRDGACSMMAPPTEEPVRSTRGGESERFSGERRSTVQPLASDDVTSLVPSEFGVALVSLRRRPSGV